MHALQLILTLDVQVGMMIAGLFLENDSKFLAGHSHREHDHHHAHAQYTSPAAPAAAPPVDNTLVY